MHPAMASHIPRGLTPAGGTLEAEAKRTAKLLTSTLQRDDDVSTQILESKFKASLKSCEHFNTDCQMEVTNKSIARTRVCMC